jgi:hypothetical protein
MSRAPSKHLDDLRLLPKEGPFKFRDYFTTPPGGKVTYWAQNGLIKLVGRDRIDCRTQVSVWELTERARRILG